MEPGQHNLPDQMTGGPFLWGRGMRGLYPRPAASGSRGGYLRPIGLETEAEFSDFGWARMASEAFGNLNSMACPQSAT